MHLDHKHITLNGKKVAVGLKWKALPGIASQSKEVAAATQELGSRFGVILSTDDSLMIGVSSSPDRVPAGAAWVAAGSKGESMVLLEPIGETHVWVCAVRNNAPQPGFDLVVPVEDVTSVLDKLRSISAFKVASKSFEGAHLELDFAEIVEGKRPPMVKQLTGVSQSFKIGLVAAVVVGIAVAAGISYTNEQERKAAQQQLANMAANDAESQRREAEARRQSEIISAELVIKEKISAAPSIADAVNAWLGAMESLPTIAANWRLKDVACTLKECKVHWARSKIGTTSEFLQYAEKAGWTVSAYDFDNAYTQTAISVPPRSNSPKDIPPEAEVNVSLMTSMQQLGIAGLSTTLKPSAPPTAAPTPSPGASAPQSASPWKIGTFSVSGTKYFQVRGVPEYINREYVTAESFKLNAETVTWTMEGSYAVK